MTTTRPTGVLPEQRRRALLEAAAAEFAAAGYERASLNRVIRAQGMSKSSFYHYFASKEALFAAVIADVGGALADAVAPPDEAALRADFWGATAALADRLSELARRQPAFRHLASLFYLPDAPPAVAASRAAVDAWIDAALRTGREVGAVAAELPLSLQRTMVRSVLWAMDEWSVARLDTIDEPEARRLAAAQTAALRGLLSPPP